MFGINTKNLNSIKKTLLNQQKVVEDSIKEIEAEDPAKGEALAEASEPGTDSYIADSHTKTLVLDDQLKKTRTSIKVALTKITNGTYGKCEKCGQQIEIKRLFAMPTASFCLPCSQESSK